MILEELFRGLLKIFNMLYKYPSCALDTLVKSLANHLTSENDMRSRYKRKKFEIEQAFNRTLSELQEKKLPKEGK